MSSPRVLLVEIEGLVVEELTSRLTALGVEVATSDAAEAVKRLVAAPPALAVVSLELTQGSGFGLVNRVLRMEALAGLRIVLVAEKATDEAIDAHRTGPTPATAYVKRAPGASSMALAEAILEVAQRILTDPVPGEEGGVVSVERREIRREKPDPLATIIAELGYRVLRRLRDEDGGAVFACMDDELHRAVAIKLMPPSSGAGGDDERMQRFQRERRILALLHSPHVIGVYGAGAQRGTPYLVRELIDGESLAGQIAREGPLDAATALRHVRETALGLRHAAAAGVIHRNVRPENIHVVDGHTKLAGFGMGRRDAPDEARITHAGLQLPDTTYVAPERIRGQEDARGDIYALGVTLHTLVAGRPPFLKPSPVDPITGRLVERPMSLEDARPGTPESVVALVQRLMAEDPAQRPQDWDAAVALLDEALRAVTNESRVPEHVEEPEAVHGTLRLMSVTEIVQSLELARKTALVTLPADEAEGGEGRLVFEEGRLVHASRGDPPDGLRGEEAFFALAQRTSGAFRVQYEPLASLPALERNIDAAVTGLLLEAARRADEAAPAPPSDADAAAVEAAFLEFADDAHVSAAAEVALPAQPARAQRQVPTAWGFAAIAVCTGLAVYGGLQVPWSLGGASGASDEGVAGDPSAPAVAALLAAQHERAQQMRAQLAAVQPRLAAFEEQRASVESAEEAARRRAARVQTNLAAALKPELDEGRFALRLSDEGSEAVLEIGERALFNGDGDAVNADGRTVLARITGAIAALSKVQVRVEGHSDDGAAPRPHRNNWGFSGARAMAVADVLAEQGLPRARLRAVALADTKPLVQNRGARNRAKNRRIELHLIPSSDEP